MTASITLFAAVTSATGQQLDDDLTLTSNQAPIPCIVSGTNAITLTQKSNVYTAAAYTNNMQLSGIAVGTNGGNVTARLGSLAILKVYKDTATGPALLTGAEIVSGNAFTLMYDASLDTGNGGFHLFTNTAITHTAQFFDSLTIGNGQVLNRYLTATASVSFSIFGANSAQESQIALSGVQVNDAILVGPPALTANQAVTFMGYVPAAGTVALRGVNAAAATVSVAPGIYRVSGMG